MERIRDRFSPCVSYMLVGPIVLSLGRHRNDSGRLATGM